VRHHGAVKRLVTADPDGELSWRTVVAATGTFHEVAAPTARRSMPAALMRHEGTDTTQPDPPRIVATPGPPCGRTTR
jgi:hypothetical protein